MQFVTRKRDTTNFASPQEMYDDYKSRKINGIQDYQSKMLDSYMEKGIDKSDVALELPTGTGKTLMKQYKSPSRAGETNKCWRR